MAVIFLLLLLNPIWIHLTRYNVPLNIWTKDYSGPVLSTFPAILAFILTHLATLEDPLDLPKTIINCHSMVLMNYVILQDSTWMQILTNKTQSIIFGSGEFHSLRLYSYLMMVWALWNAFKSWLSGKRISRTNRAVLLVLLVLSLSSFTIYSSLGITQAKDKSNTPQKFHEPTSNQVYTILARQESITGFVAVVDLPTPKHGNIRIMRCDHTILGLAI